MALVPMFVNPNASGLMRRLVSNWVSRLIWIIGMMMALSELGIWLSVHGVFSELRSRRYSNLDPTVGGIPGNELHVEVEDHQRWRRHGQGALGGQDLDLARAAARGESD